MRLYPSRRWDALMLVCGLLMFGPSLIVVAYDRSSHNGWVAAIGLGIVLLALSDLLVGRGARWIVVVLRAVANLMFASVLVMVLWAVVGGDDLAVLWLAGGVAGLVFAWMVRASRANDLQDARASDGDQHH